MCQSVIDFTHVRSQALAGPERQHTITRSSTMKLAVLTSGGDSAGMNAVVRTVVKKAILEYDYLYYSTRGAPA